VSAISGTRRSMKELVDGTLRVQIDIDPAFRDEFLRSFSKIDMPVALAPLIADFERKQPAKVDDNGDRISAMYRSGFWSSPKVMRALNVTDSRLTHEALRKALSVEHLSELDPTVIRQWAIDNRVEYCLPPEFKE
jgi:hypothetical protein